MTTDSEAGLWSIQILGNCYSGYDAWNESQKASEVKRSDEKAPLKPFRRFESSVHMFKIHGHDWQKQRSASCRLNAVDFRIFDWWDPTINRVPSIHWWIDFALTLAIEWSKRQDEMKTACCSLPWSVVTRASIVRSPRNAKLQRVGDVCLAQQQMSPMSPRSFAKLSYALWIRHEVVLRTGFRRSQLQESYYQGKTKLINSISNSMTYCSWHTLVYVDEVWAGK